MQIERNLEINHLRIVTKEVGEKREKDQSWDLAKMSCLKTVGFLSLVSQETKDETRSSRISRVRDARAALERAAFEALIVNDAATDSVLSSPARLYVEPS